MDLVYAFGSSFLGEMLAAKSAKGLCFVGLWQKEDHLLQDLQNRFPKASLVEDADRLKKEMDELLEYLRGEVREFSLEVDLMGTPFQIGVWQALMRVPYGKTLTYTQLASSMGLGAAFVRAVAHGCATNPVSLVVPCHRILRRDGNLGGYYWGLERKQALLEMEGARPKKAVQPSFF